MTVLSIRKKCNHQVKTKDLTPRQSQILTFMLRCWSSGFIPTVRRIGDEFGISSPNGVMCHITAMCKKGYAIRNKDRCGYQLTDKSLNLVL